ncbi:MAG: YkuS family protein [Firmicutes bacterium]|nr:YkuS family protein [Bacillota bacterium]
MQRKIAVDANLTPVRNLLEQEGYQVVPLSQLNSADCVVVTGGADNIMGIQTTSTKATIIAAPGMSAEEIVAQVKNNLK